MSVWGRLDALDRRFGVGRWRWDGTPRPWWVKASQATLPLLGPGFLIVAYLPDGAATVIGIALYVLTAGLLIVWHVYAQRWYKRHRIRVY